MMPEARDIDGTMLRIGDIVEETEERIVKFPALYGSGPGCLLRIDNIYVHPVDKDVVLSLVFCDGSGSRWHSDPRYYRKIRGKE